MKVFISWSGDRSRLIAETFRRWLPNVIQAVEPFMSSQDIKRGTRGMFTLTDELANANVGLLCLTPENKVEPWVLFEAGALSKTPEARLFTLLHDLKYADILPPLSQFQHTHLNSKDEVGQMVESINDTMTTRLDGQRLQESFATWYPQLEERMRSIPTAKSRQQKEKRSEESKWDEVVTRLRNLERPPVSKDVRIPLELFRETWDASFKQCLDKIRERPRPYSTVQAGHIISEGTLDGLTNAEFDMLTKMQIIIYFPTMNVWYWGPNAPQYLNTTKFP